MVPFPVDDRGQRQLVEAILGGFDRAHLQADVLAAALQPAQARPVGTGSDRHPDVRRGDLATEVPANHRHTRGTAVHLIELGDVREARTPSQQPPSAGGRCRRNTVLQPRERHPALELVLLRLQLDQRRL